MKYIAAFLLMSSTGHAVLPPAWQGIKELQTILQDRTLSQYLDSGDYIEGINRTENGWAITTNHGLVEVEVRSLPQDVPGPEKFELKFTSQRSATNQAK